MTTSKEIVPDSAAVFGVIDRYQPAVVDELHAALDNRLSPPYTLMRYHLGWEDESGSAIEGRGGKMLRPALCLLANEAFGEVWEKALPAAAAIELLHNFTLIHDDVEDASEQRHGRKTIWSIWGEAQAINTGDGMFALAYATLLKLSQRGYESDVVLRAVQMLDSATLHLCEGQHGDLLGEDGRRISCAQYIDIIEGKTAELIATSCALGTLLGGGSEEDCAALYEYGRQTGLAFQIRDDVLGIWGDVSETGKPASDDLRVGKQSCPIVYALEGSASDDRDALLELLAKDTRDEQEIEAARGLLEALGAKDESERRALDHAEAAIVSLDKLDLPTRQRNEFAQIATFAAHRSH
jgi:geranylgeranyl diphosphate synthase type I